MTTQGNLIVGKPDVSLTAPSHVKGVKEGNEPVGRSLHHRPGMEPTPDEVTFDEDARRSTGINARSHRPIDPSSPLLWPA